MLKQGCLFIFESSYLNANGATDPNSAVGNQGAQILISNIQDMNTTLKGLNLPKHIPVGTSDAGAYFNTLVLEAIEFGVSYSSYRRFTPEFMVAVRWQMTTHGSPMCRSTRPQGGPGIFSRRIMSNQRQRCPTTRRCILQRLVGHRYKAFYFYQLNSLTKFWTGLQGPGEPE